MTEYIYTQEDRLKFPHKYMYSEFHGVEFLNAYLADRLLKSQCSSFLSNDPIYILKTSCRSWASSLQIESDIKDGIFILNTAKLLTEILSKLLLDEISIGDRFNLLIKRFEVSKRIYEFYDKNIIKGNGSYTLLDNYLLFSLVLCLNYRSTSNFQYLSTLLKVNDLMLSIVKTINLNISQEKMLSIIVAYEVYNVISSSKARGIYLNVS